MLNIDKNIPIGTCIPPVEENGRLKEFIYQFWVYSPPIPEDRTKIEGYGQKIPLQRVKEPDFMFENIPITKVVNKSGGKNVEVEIVDWTKGTPQQLEYIRQQLSKCYKTGHFVYIGGELRWLTPWMYMFFNFWRCNQDSEDGYVEYRDKQRRIFAYLWYIYTETEIYGINYMKGRRDGWTAIQFFLSFWFSTNEKNQSIGVRSMDMELAKKNFKSLLRDPLSKMVSYLRPHYHDTDTSVTYTTKPEKPTLYNPTPPKPRGMGGKTVLEAATEAGFDGTAKHLILDDEVAKEKKYDYAISHARQIKCLSMNGKRIGLILAGSTVEDAQKGGENFRKVWENSKLSTMGKNMEYRHTLTKVVNLFFKTSDGYPGYVDRYGNSIIDTPTDEQYEDMLKNNPYLPKKGAAQIIKEDKMQALEAGQEYLYQQLCLQNPESEAEAFMTMNQNNPLFINIIKGIIEALPNPNVDKFLRKGYFRWGDVIRKTNPYWVDDVNGPVELTWLGVKENIYKFKPGINGSNAPIFNKEKGIFSIDPYRNSIVKNNAKSSKLAMLGKLFFDKPYMDYHLHIKNTRGVYEESYLPRPCIFLEMLVRSNYKDDFEQVIMIMTYYSMYVNIENEAATALTTYIIDRGFEGFLLTEPEVTGKTAMATDADYLIKGYNTKPENIDTGIDGLNDFLLGQADHLQEHTYDITEEPIRWPFMKSLQDALNFNKEDRTKNDLTMANIGLHLAEYNLARYKNPYFTGQVQSSVVDMGKGTNTLAKLIMMSRRGR
jgi:hypothetical protein